LFSYVVCNHEDKDASFFVNATPGETGLQTYPQQKLISAAHRATQPGCNYDLRPHHAEQPGTETPRK
jgi:hypothetical protein